MNAEIYYTINPFGCSTDTRFEPFHNMSVSCCLGDQMYKQYADDSHLPRIYMVECRIPTLAAVVAAPILKL